MKKVQGKENAYLTVEACIIMPIVFYTIIFLIYVGFYNYNKCVLQQDIFRMLLRGNQDKFSSNEEVAQKIKEEDAKWYYDKYVLCRWEDKLIEVSHGEIRIRQQAAMETSTPVLIKWLGREWWKVDCDFTCTRIRPTNIIRDCRKLERIVERKEDGGVGIRTVDGA